MSGKKYCIYLCTNIKNKKRYVGRTCDYKKRIRRHLNPEKKRNNYFDNCLRKYGVDSFVWVILQDNLNYNESVELEIFYIAKYDTIMPNGMNMTSGGEGVPNYKMSEERKRQISIFMKGNSNFKGKHHTAKTKQRIGLLKIGNKNWLGKHHSEESRIKMSEWQKGRKLSEETKIKKKLSVAKKNYWRERKRQEQLWLMEKDEYAISSFITH